MCLFIETSCNLNSLPYSVLQIVNHKEEDERIFFLQELDVPQVVFVSFVKHFCYFPTFLGFCHGCAISDTVTTEMMYK